MYHMDVGFGKVGGVMTLPIILLPQQKLIQNVRMTLPIHIPSLRSYIRRVYNFDDL